MTKTLKRVSSINHYQTYGFIIVMSSVFLFCFLLLLPYFNISVDCKELVGLKVGAGTYSFPLVLFAGGLIVMLNLGTAIVKRIVGK